jgi:type I restriction enzyme S subunit
MPPKKSPAGWLQVSLGELCLPVATVQPGDKPNDSFTYFDIGGIDNRRNLVAETKTVLGKDAPSRARHEVRKGDILFSTVRTYLRNIARIEDEPTNPVASTGFTVIRPGPGAAGEFVFQQILSERFMQPLHALQTGSSYPAVRDRDVFAQPVVLPPAAEQERIVEKLDAILPHVSAGEAAAQRALSELKRYRASVLHAAVTGELTREWRRTQPKPAETGAAFLRRLLATRRARWEEAELARLIKSGKPLKDNKWKARYPEPTEPDTTDLPALPRGWAWGSVGQTGFVIGGLTKNPRRVRLPLQLPYLRVANVYADELRLDDVVSIGVTEAELDKLLLRSGDLLVVEGNGSKAQIGRLAVWHGEIPRCVHQNHIIKVRPTESAISEWMLRWLLSPAGRHEIERVASSTSGLYTLSVGKVGSLPVPLPPPDEQEEIVRQVKHRLTLADRLTASLETALARARAWRQSVLNTAFAGQLVPQSANDEPATVLLAKIRAAREILAAQPKPKRGRGGRKKTMKAERRKLLEVLKETKAPMKPEDLFAAAGFDESTVEAFYSELKDLVAKKKVREVRDPQDRGFVRLEVRA